MLQIAQALAGLHAHHIAHLDLKPANVLLSRFDGDDIEVRVRRARGGVRVRAWLSRSRARARSQSHHSHAWHIHADARTCRRAAARCRGVTRAHSHAQRTCVTVHQVWLADFGLATSVDADGYLPVCTIGWCVFFAGFKCCAALRRATASAAADAHGVCPHTHTQIHTLDPRRRRSSARSGTPGFMAPELENTDAVNDAMRDGDWTAGVPADMYALGSTIKCLLSFGVCVDDVCF